MAELRGEHLGIAVEPHLPSVRARLQAGYEAVMARKVRQD